MLRYLAVLTCSSLFPWRAYSCSMTCLFYVTLRTWHFPGWNPSVISSPTYHVSVDHSGVYFHPWYIWWWGTLQCHRQTIWLLMLCCWVCRLCRRRRGRALEQTLEVRQRWRWTHPTSPLPALLFAMLATNSSSLVSQDFILQNPCCRWYSMLYVLACLMMLLVMICSSSLQLCRKYM